MSSKSVSSSCGSSCFLPIALRTAQPARLYSRIEGLSFSSPFCGRIYSCSWRRKSNHHLSAPLFSSCPNLGIFSFRLNSTRKSFRVRGLKSAPDRRGDAKAESGVEAALESKEVRAVESGRVEAERLESKEVRAVESGRVEALEAKEIRAVESGRVEAERRTEPRVGKGASVMSTMVEILDLEKQFSFYGAYHNNKVNVFIHILFVWPIFYTSLILYAYTPALAPLPLAAGTLPLQGYMVLNCGFIQAAVYALYYIALDKKAGSLGALICMGCWVGANAVAQALPWSLSWKIVLASQVTCWFFQVFGHQKFEGRAPALLDNLPQAFLMAPFFVLLECLQAFGYEPYPGFQKKVQKNVDDAIREFKASKEQKVA